MCLVVSIETNVQCVCVLLKTDKFTLEKFYFKNLNGFRNETDIQNLFYP